MSFRIAYSPLFAHPLPEGHRFPMEKYELIPQQLLHEGTITRDYLFEPEDMGWNVIALTHDHAYIDRLRQGKMSPKEMRGIGFPWSPELIDRERFIMYGTVQAALSALDNGIAFNIAGGTHHAFADSGDGFCIFNDLAITANYLLSQKKAKRILVVDLDVHQGDGTAALFRNNDKVFTFSMHGKNNYPLHKQESDLDIPLEDGTDDEEYLSILRENLPRLIETHKPDFILYQSGVDILATDKLGKMNLSIEGCKTRDAIVLTLAREKEIPLTAAMGGGYSADIRDIVEAHCNLYRLAAMMY
jgi:acetoin utilization deacetylase AcuC-like enzyme